MEKINKSFGLSLIGFDNYQTKNFLAILSLAERRLFHEWHVVDVSHADFFLFATEKSQSEAFITKKNLPKNRCLFCTQHLSSEYDSDVLFVPPEKVPLLSTMVKLLNEAVTVNFFKHALTDSLYNAEPIIVKPNNVVELSDDDNFFNPDRSFLKTLLKNATERLVYHFNTPESSYELYVDPVKRMYYCEASLKDIAHYLNNNDITIDSNVVLETQWANVTEQTTSHARPLANLIWYIAIELSKGRLLLGHPNQDNVYLTRWPDLGMEGCGKYVKLAAFMRNNTVCLNTVAAKTTIPLREVYNFYNASYLIGLVEKTTLSELRTTILNEEKLQLLVKITNRLKKSTILKQAGLNDRQSKN